VRNTGKYNSELTVDAANGVGADKVKALAKHLGEALTIHICNDGSTGKLNYRVYFILKY
jgi:phosphoacetylglucosamine mutase